MRGYYCYYCFHGCLSLPITRAGLRSGWCGRRWQHSLQSTPLPSTPVHSSINISWLGPELRPPGLTEPGQTRAGYPHCPHLLLQSARLRVWRSDGVCWCWSSSRCLSVERLAGWLLSGGLVVPRPPPAQPSTGLCFMWPWPVTSLPVTALLT